MHNELILSPEELYYMGRMLQAKYIDYAYVAAMKDISSNYALFEKETKDSLVSSGILMEDFSGNLEIDPRIAQLLNPVFFGETETSLDICRLGVEDAISVFRFHFYDGAITMVTNQKGKLIIKCVDRITIKNIVEDLLPDGYNAEARIIDEPTEGTITAFIAAKNAKVGISTDVQTYFEADGVIYRESEEYIESVSRDMFISDVYDVVKGE